MYYTNYKNITTGQRYHLNGRRCHFLGIHLLSTSCASDWYMVIYMEQNFD